MCSHLPERHVIRHHQAELRGHPLARPQGHRGGDGGGDAARGGQGGCAGVPEGSAETAGRLAPGPIRPALWSPSAGERQAEDPGYSYGSLPGTQQAGTDPEVIRQERV